MKNKITSTGFLIMGFVLFVLTHASYWRILLNRIDMYGLSEGLRRAEFFQYGLIISIIFVLAGIFISRKYRQIEKIQAMSFFRAPIVLHIISQVLVFVGLIFMFNQCNAPDLYGNISRCKDDGREAVIFVIFFLLPAAIAYVVGTVMLFSRKKNFRI